MESTSTIRLLQLDATIAARCAEIGEDVASYLQRISLPAAEAHGNEIEAEALEDYVDALISERLAAEPLLLTHAAEALRCPKRMRTSFANSVEACG